ncbi:hypothetical protein QFZ20_003886 [Flavobacterium sp. W4I14]|nr:hypothetical protein [Flavobacterium sp. W4I14]
MKFTYRFIENATQSIIEGCDDKMILNEAHKRYNSKDIPEDPYSFWTKSDLLFKLGRVDDAISEIRNKKMRDGKNRRTS